MAKNPPELDPKLIEVLAKGGLSPVVLDKLDHTVAHTMRHRLYRERLKMRQAGHPDTNAANKATISIQDDPKNPGYHRLLIYPANLLIEAALERAGITSNDPPPLDD